MSVAYRILVTGSNSGIGRRIVETLARAGHHIFAGVRQSNGKNAADAAALQEFAAREQLALHVVELDVTQDESVQAALDQITRQVGGLDVLINNAGIAALGILEAFSLEQVRTLFETNVLGVLRLNRAVLPAMRVQKSGLLLHISSTMGRHVIPFTGPYTASKFALEALAEMYHYELKPQGIESVVVEPGTVATNILASMLLPAEPERAAAYGALGEQATGLIAGLQQLFQSPQAPNPQDVADAVLRVIAAAPGKRPFRTVVDQGAGPAIEALNHAAATTQAQVFTAMGMTALLAEAPAESDAVSRPK